jgi:hypothetical protein
MPQQPVIPTNFPELRLICWHRDPGKPITEVEAFGLYERNWRYIDHDRLTDSEKALINRLKDKYGNGIING